MTNRKRQHVNHESEPRQEGASQRAQNSTVVANIDKTNDAMRQVYMVQQTESSKPSIQTEIIAVMKVDS